MLENNFTGTFIQGLEFEIGVDEQDFSKFCYPNEEEFGQGIVNITILVFYLLSLDKEAGVNAHGYPFKQEGENVLPVDWNGKINLTGFITVLENIKQFALYDGYLNKEYFSKESIEFCHENKNEIINLFK